MVQVWLFLRGLTPKMCIFGRLRSYLEYDLLYAGRRLRFGSRHLSHALTCEVRDYPRVHVISTHA